MKKKKMKIIFGLILIVLFALLAFCIKDIYKSLKNTEEVKTIMEIKDYGYTLNDNDSPYFKDLFEKLNDVLTKEEISEEEYASLVGQLFVTDFYSLQYVLSKSDVGGQQFVAADYRDLFVKFARDSIYSNVESNIYGKRNQELPNVKKVEVSNVKKEAYEGEKLSDENAYYITLDITYDEDLEYDSKVELVLIHNGKKLEVVKVN